MISRLPVQPEILMPVKQPHLHKDEALGNQGCGCSPPLASQET
ncbi:hypothetical protein C4K40_3535 [Pseudomonas sp. CMR5c]|nr:hypothetical protein C4K40_3535 [Pseudomonas sp. CMR5c]